MQSVLLKAHNGVPGDKKANLRAQEFLQAAQGDPEKAASKAIDSFLLTGSSTGFVSGVGGLTYSALALPADMLYLLYLSVRLGLIIAGIFGRDLESISVRSMAQGEKGLCWRMHI
jgi:hypothetical protein